MTQAYELDAIASLARVVTAALTRYPQFEGWNVDLINLSENATYLLSDPDSAERAVLRVHRADYSSLAEICSELAWINALREDGAVKTPAVIASADGRFLEQVEATGSNGLRTCVVFEFIDGENPTEDNMSNSFETLGSVSARIHNHAENWTPPTEFTRRVWDLESILGSDPLWGHWEDGIAVGVAERRVLEPAIRILRARLDDYGTEANVFGLVHADMRLANILLTRTEGCVVIDFDDSGYSWYLWDLATALTFIENRSDRTELIRRWLCGYERHRPLSDEDKSHIGDLVMLRRLLVLAWIGSHTNTPLAQSEGRDYTRTTCELAQQYVSAPENWILR